MAYDALILEADKIALEFPEFGKAFDATRMAALDVARKRFQAEPDGIFAKAGSLYELPIRPYYLQLGSVGAGLGESWVQNVSTPGWTTTLMNNAVINNVVLGIQGYYLTGIVPKNRIQALQILTGATTFPIIWIEGAVDQMEKPCVVFPEGYVLPPQSPHQVYMSVKNAGNISLQPFGVAFVKQHIAVATAPATS